MKPVSVTVKVGSESKTFTEPKNENPLRGLEQAREWLKEQHVTLARERDEGRKTDHIAAQVKILRKLGRGDLADALESGDIPRFQQLEAQRVQGLGDHASQRSVRPAPVKAKAK